MSNEALREALAEVIECQRWLRGMLKQWLPGSDIETKTKERIARGSALLLRHGIKVEPDIVWAPERYHRALASLPEGAETPVAWRWEETKLGPGDWRYSEEGPNPHRTCQALYTRPEPAGAKTPRYSEELRLLKAGYAAGKEWASRWIGVDESLPEDEQSVVVWKAGRFNSFDKTCRHRGEWLMPSNEQRDAITHWMLPNPPGAAIDEATKP